MPAAQPLPSNKLGTNYSLQATDRLGELRSHIDDLLGWADRAGDHPRGLDPVLGRAVFDCLNLVSLDDETLRSAAALGFSAYDPMES